MAASIAHRGGTLKEQPSGVLESPAQEGEKWMETNILSMVELMQARAEAGSKAREKATSTAQSYVLQEAEAV